MSTQAAAEELAGRAAALLQPISGGSPAGDNAQYDPRHEALRAEVAKLDSPSGGEVDWPVIVSGCHALLSGTSKDLLLASYYTFGLLQTEGLFGAAIGLEVIRGLVDEYWESMHPPLARMRGRTNALDWLVARLQTALPQVPLAPPDRAALDAVGAAFAAMAAATRDKMGGDAPGMTPVAEALQRMDMKIPKAVASTADIDPAANESGVAAAVEPAEPSPQTAPELTNAAETAPQPEAQSTPAPESAPESAPPPATESAPPPATESAPPPAPAGPDAKARQSAARWLAPVPGAAPTGTDARYDPEHEAMRSEVAKLDSFTDDEVDWAAVERAAGSILESKSKDVLAASYLAFAQWKRNGVEGLALGLAIVDGLFKTFEADRWPSRERGQGNAVGWLTSQLERTLELHQPAPRERETLKVVEFLLKDISSTTRDRLDEHAPSFRPISDRVQRMLLSIPEPKPELPKPPPAAAVHTPGSPSPTAAPSAVPMPSATAEAGSAEEVGKYLLETGRALVKAANMLRRSTIASATAYRLLRQGLYLHLEGPPPADGGNKTQVPPVPAPRRLQLDTIAANGKWAALLEETESALMQFRFSLDLHRLSAQALVGLGHADAAAALIAEIAGLVRRMPSWPDLLAADGSPLADATTRDWIAEHVASGGGGGGGRASGPDDGADPDAIAKAKQLLSTGKAPDAIKVAQESIDAATRPRHRFTRRLALAELCLSGGQAKLARGVFGSLQRELDELGISEWEPALAARCLEGVVKSIRASTQKGAPPDPAGDLAFERLCRLDPAAAARLATP